MLTTSASAHGVGIGQDEFALRQFDQRFFALLAVYVQHHDAGLGAGCDPDVGIFPLCPPLTDRGGIVARILQAMGSSGMFRGTRAIGVAARAPARRRVMQWDHMPAPLCVIERRAQEFALRPRSYWLDC